MPHPWSDLGARTVRRHGGTCRRTTVLPNLPAIEIRRASDNSAFSRRRFSAHGSPIARSHSYLSVIPRTKTAPPRPHRWTRRDRRTWSRGSGRCDRDKWCAAPPMATTDVVMSQSGSVASMSNSRVTTPRVLTAELTAAPPSVTRLVRETGDGTVGAEADRQPTADRRPPTAERIGLLGFGTTILGGCTFERRRNRSPKRPKGATNRLELTRDNNDRRT